MLFNPVKSSQTIIHASLYLSFQPLLKKKKLEPSFAVITPQLFQIKIIKIITKDNILTRFFVVKFLYLFNVGNDKNYETDSGLASSQPISRDLTDSL